jgi:hypothetical protein
MLMHYSISDVIYILHISAQKCRNDIKFNDNFRFTHFDRLSTPVDMLDMVNLLIAADFFLIATLSRWLIPQIKLKVTVGNFWIPLSTLLQAKLNDAANEIFQPV